MKHLAFAAAILLAVLSAPAQAGAPEPDDSPFDDLSTMLSGYDAEVSTYEPSADARGICADPIWACGPWGSNGSGDASGDSPSQ